MLTKLTGILLVVVIPLSSCQTTGGAASSQSNEELALEACIDWKMEERFTEIKAVEFCECWVSDIQNKNSDINLLNYISLIRSNQLGGDRAKPAVAAHMKCVYGM